MSILLKNILLNSRERDVFVEGNRIKKIGKNLDLKANEKIDGKRERAVLPGLVNCHTHAAMALFRGYADDLPLKKWLEEKIWPKEAKLTKDDIYWGTKLACLEMIKSGTTTFNDMYWFEEAVMEAVKEMGIRSVIGLIFSILPIRSRKDIEKLYEKLKRKLTEHLPINLAIAPHSIYTVSKENLIWAKNFARKNNLILHIHLSETEKEVKDCLKKYKKRPVKYLEKIGFLGENCLLIHSIWLSEKEIKILKKKKCSVVYCPCSNMKLASGIFPYKKLKKEGVNICLGTDGPATNNNLDMLEEMKFAALLQKVKEKDPKILPAKEIFNMATENGAKALRINSGEIKQGKLADLILIDLNQLSLLPGFNLASDIVYSANGSCVSDVICNGKILMRARKIEGEREILNHIKKKYGQRQDKGLSFNFKKKD